MSDAQQLRDQIAAAGEHLQSALAAHGVSLSVGVEQGVAHPSATEQSTADQSETLARRRAKGVNDFDKPLGKFFDHTILKPQASKAQIDILCAEAIECGCASVCIPPDRVAQAAQALSGSGIDVCSVVGFPNGYTISAAKVYETQRLRDLGCTEFDMVQSIGVLYDNDYYRLYCDIRDVVEAASPHITKVILETALLTQQQKIISSLVAVAAGADYLKTSTGFSSAGATLEDIALLRTIAGRRVGVKAAGGIRDYAFARRCIDAGADRIGCSRTTDIMRAAGGQSA